VADWGSIMFVCCKPRVQLFVNGRIVCCGIISLCRSAATSKIVKRFWATVRSAISSAGLHLYTFRPTFTLQQV